MPSGSILLLIIATVTFIGAEAEEEVDCVALSQQLQDWEATYENQGITIEALEELRLYQPLWSEACAADTQGQVDSTYSPDARWTGGGDAVQQWRPLVAGHFEPEDVETALCLMYHESRGDPIAKNPTSSARGLMQILTSLWGPHFGLESHQFYKPEINLWAARKIKDSQGWGAWSPYNRGLCHGL